MIVSRFLAIAIIVTGNSVCSRKNVTGGNTILEKITNEFLASINSRDLLRNVGNSKSAEAQNVNLMDTLVSDIKRNVKQAVICGGCLLAYDMIAFWRRILKLKRNSIMEMSVHVCKIIDKTFLDYDICIELVNLNLDQLLHIIDQNIIGTLVCGTLFQFYGCNSKPTKSWKVDIKHDRTDHNQMLQPRKLNEESLRVLHITDIHYDPNYSHEASANCKAPLCCQKDGKKPVNETDRAGFWSDYRKCDLRKEFIEEAFEAIRRDQKKIDFIYFTGDIISHRMWNISVETIRKDIKDLMGMFKKHFPNTRLYPVLGNHDVYPMNLFAPDSLNNTQFSTQWLYDFIADVWKEFLPADTDFGTIKRGGFYTVKEKGRPRIVAINSNVAYTLNLWVLYEDHDFYGQLQWFVEILSSAEENGETVHVLSHLPTGGSEIHSGWSQEFQKIMKRFSHIIAGVFFGHMHFDEILIYYDDFRPINIGFNGGSLTPYIDVNPNYRMYTVASDTFDVLDYDEYYVNLMKANSEERIHWEKLYSFKQEYDLSYLNPESVHKLVLKMTRNSTVRNTYYKNKVRLGGPSMQRGCDELCHRESLCAIVTNVDGDRKLCEKLNKMYVN